MISKKPSLGRSFPKCAVLLTNTDPAKDSYDGLKKPHRLNGWTFGKIVKRNKKTALVRLSDGNVIKVPWARVRMEE